MKNPLHLILFISVLALLSACTSVELVNHHKASQAKPSIAQDKVVSLSSQSFLNVDLKALFTEKDDLILTHNGDTSCVVSNIRFVNAFEVREGQLMSMYQGDVVGGSFILSITGDGAFASTQYKGRSTSIALFNHRAEDEWNEVMVKSNLVKNQTLSTEQKEQILYNISNYAHNADYSAIVYTEDPNDDYFAEARAVAANLSNPGSVTATSIDARDYFTRHINQLKQLNTKNQSTPATTMNSTSLVKPRFIVYGIPSTGVNGPIWHEIYWAWNVYKNAVSKMMLEHFFSFELQLSERVTYIEGVNAGTHWYVPPDILEKDTNMFDTYYASGYSEVSLASVISKKMPKNTNKRIVVPVLMFYTSIPVNTSQYGEDTYKQVMGVVRPKDGQKNLLLRNDNDGKNIIPGGWACTSSGNMTTLASMMGLAFGADMHREVFWRHFFWGIYGWKRDLHTHHRFPHIIEWEYLYGINQSELVLEYLQLLLRSMS